MSEYIGISEDGLLMTKKYVDILKKIRENEAVKRDLKLFNVLRQYAKPD